MRKSHPWCQEKTQWGEFVQRNKILSMVFGLAKQQQCWEALGIGKIPSLKGWKGWHRAVMQSLSLEGSRNPLGVALEDILGTWWQCWSSMIFSMGPFPTLMIPKLQKWEHFQSQLHKPSSQVRMGFPTWPLPAKKPFRIPVLFQALFLPSLKISRNFFLHPEDFELHPVFRAALLGQWPLWALISTSRSIPATGNFPHGICFSRDVPVGVPHSRRRP